MRSINDKDDQSTDLPRNVLASTKKSGSISNTQPKKLSYASKADNSWLKPNKQIGRIFDFGKVDDENHKQNSYKSRNDDKDDFDREIEMTSRRGSENAGANPLSDTKNFSDKQSNPSTINGPGLEKNEHPFSSYNPESSEISSGGYRNKSYKKDDDEPDPDTNYIIAPNGVAKVDKVNQPLSISPSSDYTGGENDEEEEETEDLGPLPSPGSPRKKLGHPHKQFTTSRLPNQASNTVAFKHNGNARNIKPIGEEDTLQFLPQKSPDPVKNLPNDQTLSPGQLAAYHKKISTLETLPSIEHYTYVGEDLKGKRPSLSELHGTEVLMDDEEEEDTKGDSDHVIAEIESEKEMGISEGPKFGWIKGVLVRCLLNIWGVMLFLRLSWVVGQAGIGLATIIIAISCLVIIITAMSMAAICTNGEIKGGGAYYMLSRSLGPEFGGAIGIIFSLANAVTVSMNIVGLAETIVELITRHSGNLMGISSINWVRIIACLFTILLLGVVMAGLDWETKTQLGFLMLLMVSFSSYFVGTFLRPSPFKMSRGVLGYHRAIFRQNFGPGFQSGENFFSVFAIFFPSFTGFLAGCNISGDLKNAQKAIPKGTFCAIFITSMSYVLMVWTFGSSVIRDATGRVSDLYSNGTILPFSALFQRDSVLRSCAQTQSCKFGLLNDYQAAELQSAFGPLITLGIFAATLSSAIASLEGAAKVFQALCKDKLFPIINYFAVGTKKHDEPVRAYFLMFAIAILCDLIANLNILAPIISNFFLMSFALINYSCFDTYMSGSVGFRPGYSYYNHWISLLGGILCIVVMFLIKWWATLVVFFCVMFFYAYVHYKKPDVNWGSSSQAHVYKNALTWVMRLNETEEHVKNFRPQILVLTGDPRSRPTLVDFVNYFTKNLSLMICGHIILENTPDYANPPKVHSIYEFFNKRRVKALYDTIRAPNLRQGAFGLLEVAGLGRLKPNILIMGFMANWRDEELVDVNNYFYIIHDAFDLRFAVGIFKMPDGLDFSFFTIPGAVGGSTVQNKLYKISPGQKKQTLSVQSTDYKQLTMAKKFFERLSKKMRGTGGESTYDLTKAEEGTANSNAPSGNDARGSISENATKTTELPIDDSAKAKLESKEPQRLKRRIMEKFNGRKKSIGFQNVRRLSKKYNRNIMASINKFQYKQPAGIIDIWWLFDDGGLTILLPYILAHRRHWETCKIRLFGLCSSPDDHEQVHSNFVSLLAKFRIEYAEVIIIPDIQKTPYPYSIQEFDGLIQNYRVRSVNDKSYMPGMITDEEYVSLLNKTHRQIRLHEMLMKYSQTSSFVVMTLPIPRKGSVSSAMYMAWLEIISKDMPPFLFLRGNQQSVITFYS